MSAECKRIDPDMGSGPKCGCIAGTCALETYTSGGHERFETPIVPIQDAVHPGDSCPVCLRRVPHPKKETSPKTRPLAYRIPLDEADAHLEVIDAVAELLGVGQEKYHRYRAISYAMLCVLQGARADETGG